MPITRIPRRIKLRITTLNPKNIYFCGSAEDYLEKYQKFRKEKIKFTYSHPLSIVRQMITTP